MSGSTQNSSTLKRYFVGYSTQNSNGTGVSTLYDIDLINADLFNAFNTRVGERVMRPDYGCKLWDYLMEPLTPALRDDIINEVVRICSLDARLVLQNVDVLQIDNGFSIAVLLLYLPWNVYSTFSQTFSAGETAYFGSNGTNLV